MAAAVKSAFLYLAVAAASGPDVPEILRDGREKIRAGRADRAQALYREALGQLGLSDSAADDRAALFEALAEAKVAQGKESDAVGAIEAAYDVLLAAFGPDNAKVGSVLGRLADAHAATGDHVSAADTLGQLVTGMRAQGLGTMHPGLRHTLTKHAAALAAAGRRADSIAAYKELIELLTPLPPEHVGGEIAAAHVALATQLAQTGKQQALQQALEYAQLAVQMHDDPQIRGDHGRLRDAEPLDAAVAANALAGVLEKLNRHREAIDQMERAHALAVAILGADDPIALQAKRNVEQLKKHVQRKEETSEGAGGQGGASRKKRRTKTSRAKPSRSASSKVEL
jgi:tetratricopeptide (TPR) repeat protein